MQYIYQSQHKVNITALTTLKKKVKV